MASWFSGRKNVDENIIRLPPMQQKCKPPVRMARLSSDSDKKPSSEDQREKKRHFQRDSVDKLGRKPPSRNGKKKGSADKKKPNKNMNPAEEQESLGKQSEITRSSSVFDDDFERHSTSSDEREMPNVSPGLREAVKEREEEAVRDQHLDINENNNNIKDDVILASSLCHIEQSPREVDNEENKHAISDEEFDCSSMSLDTEGKRAVARLDEKSSLLRAQFAEENQAAVESIENVKKEIEASQEKEVTITQEFDEIRMRHDSMEENLRRLDDVSRRREREEKKWRKKMHKRMKKCASSLEKVRAERLQYQKEMESENGIPDEQDKVVQELERETAEVAPQITECASKKVLFDPAEVKDYSSVEELEEERKELRRLEKLKKKAMKREKLERKEKKKIEKEKRRVEQKLAEMKAEKSAATENTEASKSDNGEHSDMGISDKNSKGSIAANPSVEQQSEKDTKDDVKKKESLKTTAEDLSSIEEEIDIQAESGSEADDGKSPVFNERSPLIRKQSGIFSFHGLQPFLNSSQNWTDRETDMNSSLEDDERRAHKDHVEVYTVCEDDSECIEDVIFEEFVIAAVGKTEYVEASVVSDDDLDYTEDAICEDGEEDSEKTEDIEVSSVCDEDVIWEEDVSSVGEEKNMETEDIEVSTVNDDDVDVICEDGLSSAVDDHSMQTEDVKVFSFCEDDLDYIEDVTCEEQVNLTEKDEILKTEDIEVSTVNEDGLDYIEDVIFLEERSSAGEDDISQTEGFEVASVCEEDVDYIEDVICEEVVKYVEEDEDHSDSRNPSNPVTVQCKSVYSSTFDENQNLKEQDFIDFDKLLDECEDETEQEQLPSSDSSGGKEKYSSEDVICRFHDKNTQGKRQEDEKESKIRDDEPSPYVDEDFSQAISDVDSMLSSSDEENYLSAKGVNVMAEEDSLKDSFTSVSELISEELSSCDQEVVDINGEMSEDEVDDPDSWNALDDQTFPCCRNGRRSSCLKATVGPNKGDKGDDGQLEQSCSEHEGSVAAVVNIAEHFLQKELSDALQTAGAFVNTSQTSVSSAEIRLNKEPRQLKTRHSEVTDEQQKLFITAEKNLQVSLEEMEEKNKALKEIVDFTNKENEKLLDQVIAMKEEAKVIKMGKETYETVKHELKHVKANEVFGEREVTNLSDNIEKKERQLKKMKNDLHYAQMDNKDLLYDTVSLKDKLKESEASNKDLQFQVDQLKQMVEEVKMTANWRNKEHDYSYLREEVELLKGSLDLRRRQEELPRGQLNGLKKGYTTLRGENDQRVRRDNELKGEHENIIKQLKDQLATLEKETSIADSKDQLAKFKKENSRITAELQDALEKYKQLSKLQDEKANITIQLQKRLAELEKENTMMVAELSKMSDKDKQLHELLKQVEGLKDQNNHLQREALAAKEQVADKTNNSPEESSKEDKLSKTKHKKYKCKIKKLKRRLRRNERETEHLERFARQTGPDVRETLLWLSWLKDERTELSRVRNALKLQTERVQYLQDKERELENTKVCLQQTENELVQTQDGLKLMAETTAAFKRCVREMDNYLQYADSNTCNSDISSLIDDRDRDDLNDSVNLDICPLDEDGNERLLVDSKEQADENEHIRLTVSSEKECGHRPLSTIPEHAGMTVNSGAKDEHKMLTVNVEDEAGHEEMSLNSNKHDGHKELIEKLEEGSKPMSAQVAHVNEILNDSLENIQYVKEALKQRQESWDQKSNKRDWQIANLRGCLRIQDGEIQSLKQYVTQLEEDSVEFIQELQGKLESSQNTLKRKEAILNEADDMLTSLLVCSGARDYEFDDNMDFIEKLDFTIEELKGNPYGVQELLQEKEATLKQAETILTALLVASETSDLTQLQEKLQSMPILLKEKTEALMEAEAEIQIKSSLLVIAEEKHEDIIKQVEEKLKSSQIALKEKTAALEQAEAKLASPYASLELKYEKSVKQMQEDLKMSQSLLQKMTAALDQTEAELQMKSSLLSTTEAKNNEVIDQLNTTNKELQRNLERVQYSLMEKTEALELQIKSSIPCTVEGKHDQHMRKLDATVKDLERMRSSLMEKTDVQRLKTETDEMTKYGAADVSSWPLMWTSLNARAQQMNSKIRTLRSDSDLISGHHGDDYTSQWHGTKRRYKSVKSLLRVNLPDSPNNERTPSLFKYKRSCGPNGGKSKTENPAATKGALEKSQINAYL